MIKYKHQVKKNKSVRSKKPLKKGKGCVRKEKLEKMT